MTQTQPIESQESTGFGRRDFLRRTAAGTTAAATVGYGSLRLDHSPVGNAQANPLLIGAGVAGAGVAVGWLLGHFDPLGMDSPPDGLSEDAFIDSMIQTVQVRRSNNQSTLIDNQNIVEGAADIAYSEAKITAIDDLNEGADQSTAQDSGVSHINDSKEVILSNFFSSWNESVDEMWATEQQADEFDFHRNFIQSDSSGVAIHEPYNETISIEDEFEFEVLTIDAPSSDGDAYWNPVNENGPRGKWLNFHEYPDETRYLEYEDWNPVFQEIRDSFTEARDDFITWLDTLYTEVESGEIDTTDLLSPRETAELMADEEENPRALADLQALNVPTDIDREALIELEDEDGDLFQAQGWLGYSGEEEFSTGPIEPSEKDGSIYFTSDVGEDSTNFETVHLTEPFEILSFTDTDGNEFDTTTFESREPQSDDNYITQEEWDAHTERQLELIDRHQSGGGGIDLSGLSVGGLSGELVALIAAAGAAALALGGNKNGGSH